MKMSMKNAADVIGVFGQDGLDSLAVLHAHFTVNPIDAAGQEGMMHGDNHRLAAGFFQGISKPFDLTFLQRGRVSVIRLIAVQGQQNMIFHSRTVIAQDMQTVPIMQNVHHQVG